MEKYKNETSGTSGYIGKTLRRSSIMRFVRGVWNVTAYVLILAIGLIIGYYYFAFQENRVKEESPIIDVKTLHETSIGFTERNELMLINRESGRYTVYEDSVASAIFTLLANQKYNEVINP